jgi:hypothetical protein
VTAVLLLVSSGMVTSARGSGQPPQAPDGLAYTVDGSVDFSLFQIVAPGDEFDITVRATARPHASP